MYNEQNFLPLISQVVFALFLHITCFLTLTACYIFPALAARYICSRACRTFLVSRALTYPTLFAFGFDSVAVEVMTLDLQITSVIRKALSFTSYVWKVVREIRTLCNENNRGVSLAGVFPQDLLEITLNCTDRKSHRYGNNKKKIPKAFNKRRYCIKTVKELLTIRTKKPRTTEICSWLA